MRAVFSYLHFVSHWPESNRRPTPYHGVALPSELQRHYFLQKVSPKDTMKKTFFLYELLQTFKVFLKHVAHTAIVKCDSGMV